MVQALTNIHLTALKIYVYAECDLLLIELIQLSNPQLELDFHYASRNHNQYKIATHKKETKASNTRTLCEYKP
ncbi:hypothetical protein JHK85_025393 [Glycine max]|nr:hypothetical protein JHK85_025393 [Glycine max]